MVTLAQSRTDLSISKINLFLKFFICIINFVAIHIGFEFYFIVLINLFVGEKIRLVGLTRVNVEEFHSL